MARSECGKNLKNTKKLVKEFETKYERKLSYKYLKDVIC